MVWREIALYTNTVYNRKNFQQPIQTQLSEKTKSFCQFFIAFPKCTSTFEHSEKKDEPHSLSISHNIDCERSVYLIVKKVLF